VAHRLYAKETRSYLSPEDVLTRIEAEFAFIEASNDAGRKHVRTLITQMRNLMRADKIPMDAEHLERLHKAAPAAIYVCFGDDPGSEFAYLESTVIPDEPLYFAYASPKHEKAALPLLQRCARILNYNVVGE